MFRPTRRPRLALSDAETWALLERCPFGVLAVHGAEGYPYAVPMHHAVVNRRLIFHAAAEGHRLEALRADARACFTVTEGPREDAGAIPAGSLGTYESAVVFGRVSELPPELQEEALEALVRRHQPERAGEAGEFLRGEGKVAVLRMEAEHVSGKRLLVK